MSYSRVMKKKKSRLQDVHVINQLKDTIHFISACDESARVMSEVSPALRKMNGTLLNLRKSFKSYEKIFENLCRGFKTDSEEHPLSDSSELKLYGVDSKYPTGPPIHSVEMSHDLHVLPTVKRSRDVSHDCGRECWVYGTEYKNWKMCSPLDIPLKLGWSRVTSGLLSPDTYYVAPCGKKMRSIEDISVFLRNTGVSSVSISQFTLDLNCQLETKVFNQALCIDDISVGKERKPISCVNTVNEDRPEKFEYTASRTSQLDVSLCTDPGSLICCSCTDGCRNRSKCECWQLTLQEAKMIHSKQSVGYVNDKLRRQQYSAIYECNPSCRCDLQYCTNRVVQHGIQYRLQVFRSPVEQLAWGLRTLDDIPQGSFVCAYIGHIYTEKESDKQAQLHGDAYFAELDYIEIMQYQLDNSNRTTSSPSSTVSSNFPTNTPPRLSSTPSAFSVSCSLTSSRVNSLLDTSSECDENSSYSKSPSSTSISPRQQTPTLDSRLSSSHTEEAKSPTPSPLSLQCRMDRITRVDKGCYIMDAKKFGNVGRFINHSCSPNLFVQNVFVDSQDSRFPWVALFASRCIQALEELTWDYSYDVGSVAGRNIDCLCGSANCRGRLL